MKNIVIIFLLLLIITPVLSQTKVTIKFKDHTEINDLVASKGMELQSLKTLVKYNSDSIAEVFVHNQNKVSHFYFLDTKTNSNFKTSLKGIGSKVYTNGNIDVFHIVFYSNYDIRYLEPESYISKREVYLKRKNEYYAYNIGCMDGSGCVGIKKRLKKFFHDCPELIKEMRKNKIKDWEIIKIVNLYNTLCAE
jgi:hypothetical protein|tara:strand:- start:7613 stop:8191 length:579 start_codon:yes stop_codon:yes gene_type:complete